MANIVKKRPTLGFFVSELENPYTRTLYRGITEAAAEFDVNVIVFPGKSPKVPYDYSYQYNAIYTLAAKENVDALIWATGTLVNFLDDVEFKAFRERYDGIPLVSISIPLEGASSLLIDNKVGLRHAIEHLITVHGYKRIAFIGGPVSNIEAQERLAIYETTLRAHGLEFDPNYVVNGDFTKYSGVRAITEMLDDRKLSFDALAVANDEMALSAMEELKKRGFRIPEDIAIIGFDDVESAKFSKPKLTTVAQPIYVQAHSAVKFALDLIEGKEASTVSLPTFLVLRESCGCAKQASTQEAQMERLAMLEEYYESDRIRWEACYNDIIAMRDILNLLIYDVNSSKAALRAILPNLKEMGMGCFYTFLHDHPEKHTISTDWEFAKKLTLMVASDENRQEDCFKLNGASMYVNSILDGHIYSSGGRYTIVISSLFYMDEHIGFVACAPNFSDIYIFETLTTEISCALKLINLVQTRNNIEKQLQTALTELERYNEQLSNISETDELTELFNRRGFLTHARHMMSMGRRMKKNGLLFFADLDGLKVINDTYGHEEGDNAIKVVASVLKKTFRDSDIMARLGGDEFTVFTLNTKTDMYPMFEERISHHVDEYNQKSNKPYEVSVSVGVVPFHHTEETDVEALMHKADMMLYQNKKAKKAKKALEQQSKQ